MFMRRDETLLYEAQMLEGSKGLVEGSLGLTVAQAAYNQTDVACLPQPLYDTDNVVVKLRREIDVVDNCDTYL